MRAASRQQYGDVYKYTERLTGGSDNLLSFELVVAIAALVVFCGICVISYSMPISLAKTFWVGAGGLPFILGMIMIILTIWWIADLIISIRKERETRGDKPKIAFWDELIGDRKQKISFVLIVLSTLVLVFVLIPVLGSINREFGFTIATFIFLFITVKLFTDLKIPKILLISATASIIIYIIFKYVLMLPMPR